MGRSPVLFAQQLAEAKGGGGSSSWTMILLFVLMIVAMYFLLIRPQQKRKREQQQMQSNAGVGAQIMTVGGLYGTIVANDDESVTIEVSPGVTNRYAKGAIGRVITPAGQASQQDDTEDVDDEISDEFDETVEEPRTADEPAAEVPDDKEQVTASKQRSLPRDPTAT